MFFFQLRFLFHISLIWYNRISTLTRPTPFHDLWQIVSRSPIKKKSLLSYSLYILKLISFYFQFDFFPWLLKTITSNFFKTQWEMYQNQTQSIKKRISFLNLRAFKNDKTSCWENVPKNLCLCVCRGITTAFNNWSKI